MLWFTLWIDVEDGLLAS